MNTRWPAVRCRPSKPTPNGKRVAVVGAGPGGLACADELCKLGYAVTVYESQLLPGGLLLFGIPAFKLEKAVVERRVNILRQQGVEFKFGVTVGKDIGLDDLLAEHQAVFLGIGALKSKALDVPGAELKGVYQGLPFLAQKNAPISLGLPPVEVKGKRVVVLGGGDSAMDCLRTAIRCGAADTVCAYRRDLANMPGSRKEYANALEEGARFLFLTNPIALEGNAERRSHGGALRAHGTGRAGRLGPAQTAAVKGSEFTLPADLILIAYGFDPVPFPPGSDLSRIAVNEWGGTKTECESNDQRARSFRGGRRGTRTEPGRACGA